MALDIWTIVAADDADPLEDPHQIVHPRLKPGGERYPTVDWLAADQAIRHHDSSGFEVMINDGSRFRTMLEVPGADVKVAVSDRRVVLVHADVDPGASSLTRAADFLLGGNVGT